LTYHQSLLSSRHIARNKKRTLTAKTTATNRNRLKSISHQYLFNKRKITAQKSPPQVSRFFAI